MGRIGIAGLICCGVSLALIVVSASLPYWRQDKGYVDNYVVLQGLWMVCYPSNVQEETWCKEMTSVPEYYLAVRALVLMGLFMAAIASILGSIGIFAIRQKNIYRIAGVIAISEGICMLIGAFVFVGRTNYFAKGAFVQYHVGFAFAIVAGVVGIVAGVLFIRARPSEENQFTSQLLH